MISLALFYSFNSIFENSPFPVFNFSSEEYFPDYILEKINLYLQLEICKGQKKARLVLMNYLAKYYLVNLNLGCTAFICHRIMQWIPCNFLIIFNHFTQNYKLQIICPPPNSLLILREFKRTNYHLLPQFSNDLRGNISYLNHLYSPGIRNEIRRSLTWAHYNSKKLEKS